MNWDQLESILDEGIMNTHETNVNKSIDDLVGLMSSKDKKLRTSLTKEENKILENLFSQLNNEVLEENINIDDLFEEDSSSIIDWTEEATENDDIYSIKESTNEILSSLYIDGEDFLKEEEDEFEGDPERNPEEEEENYEDNEMSDYSMNDDFFNDEIGNNDEDDMNNIDDEDDMSDENYEEKVNNESINAIQLLKTIKLE